jgi:uncharacterized membrane protein
VIDVRYVAASFKPSRVPLMPWTRVNSLIDGIFGFSATVLMLRLATPAVAEGQLGPALLDQAPSYALYAMGFLQTIGTWSVMRRLSQWSVGLDYYAMVFAFATLMMWATLPFTVNVLAEAVGNEADVESAVRLMALTLLLGMIGYTALFWRLDHCGWLRDDLDPRILDAARWVSYTIVAWPLAVFALSYVNAWVALAVYIGAALLSIAPLDAMSTRQYAELER